MQQQSWLNVPSALSGFGIYLILLLVSGCRTQNGIGVQPTPTPSPAQTLAHLSVYATADGGALVGREMLSVICTPCIEHFPPWR